MRLLTRSDFDGLACGAILKELGIIDSWKFVHPKDLQDGLVEVTDNDVLANVPYVPGCAMWFDHHSSEMERLENVEFVGECRLALSAARVIYDYYDCAEKMPHLADLITAVDKVDSGTLNIDDIQNPSPWVLLGYIMDPRTGLGRFSHFTISNYSLMEKLIECCQTLTIDEILDLPDVQERVQIYFEQNKLFRQMILEHSKVYGNLVVTDLRGVEVIYTGNRFLIYTIFPELNISMWIVDGRAKQNCAIAVGHSILNRTSQTDVGKLLLKYGGGGHKQVGTCQVPYAEADIVIEELIQHITKDG